MLRKIQCVILCLAIIFSSALIVSSETSEDLGFDLGDFFFETPTIEISNETPSFEDMKLVGENDDIKLYFYEQGLDIYVLDKASNKLWSNVLIKEYCDTVSSPEITSQLITVSVASKDSQSSYTLYDSSNTKIKASSDIYDNKVLLSISIPDEKISIEFEIGIDVDGIYYLIPEKSIIEEGSKVVYISAMNNFGAGRTDEDGYILYPDGCGTLIKYKHWDEENSLLHVNNIYGNNFDSYLNMERNIDYNIENILLPIYGIKHNEAGFVSVLDEGEADSSVNLAMPGYQISGIYRAFFTHNYRYYSNTNFNDTDVTALVEKRVKTDIKVKYLFISGKENNYSGMAKRVREYFLKNEKLTSSVDVNSLPVTIEIIGAVMKKGLLSSKVEPMTTFNQAERIIKEVNNIDGIKPNIVLSGWGKGGWDTLPTTLTPESKLGGKSSLNSLAKYCKKENLDISLAVEPILANSKTGNFNKSKDTVKNYFGEPFTDKGGKKFILSAEKVINKTIERFNKSYKNFGIDLLSVGNLLFADYDNKNSSTKTEMMEAYEKAMKESKQPISVTDGNAYTLPFAKYIYEVPSNNSGYTYMDESVPFYQMVVHGSKLYTGQFSNIHYDFDEYILKCVETGSVPSFILTWKETGKLRDTDYDSVFSTEFSSIKPSIIKAVDRMSKDLAELYSKQIIEHEKLSSNTVKVTYEENTIIYINYSDEDITIDFHNVKAQDYLVVKEWKNG